MPFGANSRHRAARVAWSREANVKYDRIVQESSFGEVAAAAIRAKLYRSQAIMCEYFAGPALHPSCESRKF